MPKTTRTFVALEIPAPIGEKLTRLQTLLSPQAPGVRWSSATPFHATMAFLGDVPDEDLNEICLAVADAARPFAPFEVRVEGVGAFPNPARPRVIWAGLNAAGLSTFAELHKAIAKGLTKAGYRPDDERFNPHTTLGRIKSDRRGPQPRDLTQVLTPYQTWFGGSFTVTEVTSFVSTLTPEGPVYTALAHAPLAAKKSAASP